MSRHQTVRQGTGRNGKRSNHVVESTVRKGGNAAWQFETPLRHTLGASAKTTLRLEHRLRPKDNASKLLMSSLSVAVFALRG